MSGRDNLQAQLRIVRRGLLIGLAIAALLLLLTIHAWAGDGVPTKVQVACSSELGMCILSVQALQALADRIEEKDKEIARMRSECLPLSGARKT